MTVRMKTWVMLCLALLTTWAQAQDFVGRQEGSYAVKDFKFSTGEVMDVKLHYTTLGDPKNDAVLILHGTTSTGLSMLDAGFGAALFGPGQPLDASMHYIILPDALGTGKSTKPSDGLRAKFPRYNYDDMVQGQYRLVTEHLGVKHLRVVIGNSMGGMQTWMWAQRWPDMMDLAVPMASMPVAMSGRNWMMRRLIIDSIRNDPEWLGGNYTKQPRSWQFASVFYSTATSGGDQAIYKATPTRAKADAWLNERLNGPMSGDANDHLYLWEASGDYDAAKGLETIRARVLAINSADDERNPLSLGVMERELPRIQNARLFLIPASPETAGHGTTGQAKWWKQALLEELARTPRLNK